MKLQRTSPAGRLLSLIKEAIRNSGKTVFETWGDVLGVPFADKPRVFEGIGRLFQLIEEAKADVRRSEDLDQDLYLGSLTTIEVALTNAIGQPNSTWVSYLGSFQGAPVHALEFVAEHFNRVSTEEMVSEEVLKDLIEQLDGVISAVMDSKLDPALKKVLIEKLEEARRAILFYRLDGADGLRRAVENALGIAAVATQVTQDESAREVISRYLRLLDKINGVISDVKPYATLLPPLIHRLLGSG